MEALARAHEVSPRTLRNWKRLDPAAPPARPGPPALREEERAELVERVRAELDRQGWGAGEEPVRRALGEDVSLWQVRRVLRELKRERRRRERERIESERVHVEVRYRDALWSEDATHLGRDRAGKEVLGEALREVASTRTIALAVGSKATGEDVVALLERAAQERGGPPLVQVTDNDGPYVGEDVRAWRARNKVVHLPNLPHTPEHNAWSEHGHGELKRDSGLGKGVCVEPDEALQRLEASRDRLDHHRLRASRDWRTAVQADRETPSWHDRIDRDRFYQDATCAIREAVLDCDSPRARRRAEREAVLSTLEAYGAITRTRGGAPIQGSIEEDNC